MYRSRLTAFDEDGFAPRWLCFAQSDEEGDDDPPPAEVLAEENEKPSPEEPAKAGPKDEPPPEADWRAGIADPDHRAFAEKFASPAELARAAHTFRRKLSNTVSLPGEDADPDEIAAFHRRIGVPEDAAGYEAALSEGLPEKYSGEAMETALDGFAHAMHAAGAPKAAVDAALDWYFGDLARADAETQRARDAARAAATAGLKQEWGTEDYNANVELGHRAARAFGGDALADWLEETGHGDDPLLIRTFAAIGRQMGEDGTLIALPDDRRQSLQEEADALQASADYWSDAKKQKRVAEIMAQVHGTEKV